MTSTRQRALDAAIDLIGTEGLRSLTHARVDARAGLPKGSTSNYFRTRDALTVGVVEWMAQKELAEMAPPMSPRTGDELVELLAGMLDYTTGPSRTLTAARLALFSEAAHDDQVRAAVSRGHRLMRTWVESVLTDLGAADPATAASALIAMSEGLILHRVARGANDDPRPILRLVIGAVTD
ncbi:DNA-binding transcriptional regulator YbjK [Hamadaea flava]|uniref:TetR/AcrR family transcriptional regulator n=1 Tax=Hamadaea flava TaxID=1742688 RepID=A0ABV8LZU2_9ACTN|nr:TetR family transcriptional regulator C-terminal domain-containing protein [Hamadaea flava]MCP2328919.1 DNA-binding transcriptional regulator YbjK [Hamadaea flava]